MVPRQEWVVVLFCQEVVGVFFLLEEKESGRRMCDVAWCCAPFSVILL